MENNVKNGKKNNKKKDKLNFFIISIKWISVSVRFQEECFNLPFPLFVT
jgi:hypothetical protein